MHVGWGKVRSGLVLSRVEAVQGRLASHALSRCTLHSMKPGLETSQSTCTTRVRGHAGQGRVRVMSLGGQGRVRVTRGAEGGG